MLILSYEKSLLYKRLTTNPSGVLNKTGSHLNKTTNRVPLDMLTSYSLSSDPKINKTFMKNGSNTIILFVSYHSKVIWDAVISTITKSFSKKIVSSGKIIITCLY